MNPYYYGGGYGMNGMDLGYELITFVGHVLIIVLIVWFVFWCLRMMRGGRGHRWQMWHMHSALSTLNERFAKGEIDVKEYEERKKALMGEVK